MMTLSSNIVLEPASARPSGIESRVATSRPSYICDKSAP